jgi:hypothetical protein
MIADFASGVPDLASAPRQGWAWAIREACRAAPNAGLGYGDSAGNPRLREVLAAYLRRVRAADIAAGQVIICSGVSQGLRLVLQALAGQGLTRVGFEDPGAVASITSAAAWVGRQAVPVPVDVRGVDVAALDATGAAAVVLTPAHQWPTGVVLAPERRLALIDCAALACWPGYPAGSWPGPPGSASPPSPGPNADKPFCPSPRAPPGPTPPVSPLTAGPYCRPDPGGRQRDGNLPGQAQPGPGGRPGLGPRPGRQRPGHPQLPALDDPTRTIIGAPIVTAWGQRTGRGTWSGIWRMSASLGGGLVRLKRTLPSGRLAGPGVGHFPARP